MSTYIVTFPGVRHPLRDCYTTVEADTEYEARLVIIDVYGRGDPEGHSGFGSVYSTPEQAGVTRYNLRFVPFGVVTP